MATKKQALIPVLITTLHRGVFFGYIDPKQIANKEIVNVQMAKMAIYWGTTKGVMELANTGPTLKSLIGAKADIPALHDVTAIFSVTKEAEGKWLSA